MSFKWRYLGASALICALAVAAGASRGQSLHDALAEAYTTNPGLKAARAQLRATDENFAQARSSLLPTLSAGGSVSNSVSKFFQPGVSADESPIGFPQPDINIKNETTTYSANLTASQTIFEGGRNWNAIRQAQAQIRAGRADLTTAEQQVLLAAVTAYADVLRDEAVLRLSENNVQVLQRQLQAARDRFEVGEVTRTDVAQAEARLSGAEANQITARGQLETSRAAYVRVVGSAPGALEPLPPLPPLPATLEEARTLALRANPAMRSAREQEAASSRGVAVAKGALLPSISTDITYSLSDEPVLFDTKREATTATARVSVPIFSGGANYSRIRQARQQNNQFRMLLREQHRLTEEEATNAWEALQTARATIAAARQQVRANEIAYEGVEQEALVGSRTTLDVLDAEQELLDSRVALVRARRDEAVAAYRVLAAVGALTAADLGLDVDLYDPERNARAAQWKLIGLKGVEEE
ncbi:MAG: TolC family outer membrane protein [Parvularculaceae bacterium]